MEGQSSQDQKKASPFESMSRDELIKKCKNLLMIAQKAKQAKDESTEEIKTLQETISKYEIQKNADKESLKAMQEIVEKLNADKLTFANETESYKRKFIKLEKETKESRNNPKFAAENESLKIQINKLIEENKGLITDLTNLEKKYLQESAGIPNVAELKHQIEFLNTEAGIRNDEVKNLKEKILNLEQQNAEFTSKKEENDVEKFEIEEKIVLLEDQIQEKTSTIELQMREIERLQDEIQNLKNPDESIEKLKSDIFVLDEKVILLENENASNAEILQELKEMNENLEAECSTLRSQKTALDEVDNLKAELEKYKEMNKVLRDQLDDCHETRSVKIKENEELQSLTKEFEKMKDDKERENENLKKENQDNVEKLNQQAGIINELEASLTEIKEEYEKLKLVEEALLNKNQRIQELDEIETKNLKEKISSLETQLTSLGKEKQELQSKIERLENVNLSFENEIETKNLEIADARQRVSALEGNTPWYEEQLRNLRAENEEFKNKLNQKEGDEEQKTLKEDAKLEKLYSKIKNLEEELSTKASELDMVKTDVQSKIEKLEKNNLTFENEIETKNLEIADARQRVSALEGNSTWYEEQFRNLRAENEELKNNITQQENQKTDDSEASKFEELNKKISDLETEITTKTTEVEAIRAEMQKKIDRLENTNLAFENEIETKNFEIEDAKQRISALESNTEWYESEFRRFRAENVELQEKLKKTCEESEPEIEKLQTQIKESRERIEMLEKQLEVKQEEVNRVSNELGEAILRNKIEKNHESEQINDLNRELESLRMEKEEETDNLRINLQTMTEERDRLLVEIKNQSASINGLNQDVFNFKKEIEEIKEIATLDVQSKNDSMRELKDKLSDVCEKSHVEKQTIKAEIDEITAKLNAYKTENAELLSELKEINEILKERGEIINIQMTKISDLERAKEAIEVELRNEIEQLQKSLKEVEVRGKDEQKQQEISDTMSTSTISRMDESARLKEIDDTYEEKYNKLRGLAVKLKKKVTEQQALITKYEAENTTTTNIQVIQKENDLLKDEIDEQKKVIAQLQKQNTCNDTTEAGQEYQSQIQILKQEKETFNMAKKDLEKQIEQLKGSLTKKETELSTLQGELNKAKASIKKTSVLNLEMEAYEKSSIDLNNRFEAKKQEVKDLEVTIKTQAETIESVKSEVKLLEESLESERKHSKELKHQIDLQQASSRENEHEKSELKIQVDDLIKQLEQVKLESDENRLYLAELVTEKEKVLSSFELEKAKFMKTNFSLEEKVENLMIDLKNKETELDDIKTEFTSYKVRAQSVLRQNQSKESGREKELEDELENLQSILKKEQDKLKEMKLEKGEMEKQCQEMSEEKQRIQSRCKELLNLLEEVRVQGDNFAEETQRKLIEKDEQLKTQKIQNETLRLCYEKQIQEVVEKHEKEIGNLKIKSQQEISIAAVESSMNNNNNNNNNDRLPVPFGVAPTDEQKISMILLQREEGEGSESTNPYPVTRKTSRGRRDLIPLDELLNTSFEENTFIEERTISPTIELHETKEKLSVQESQVKHLTSLLAEAEQDLGKLTQLNDVLKEEVRRQQRSIEREEHAQNSEYLKNVILKFLTLSSGDERSRLVPVLNTILKLSPDETQKLQSAAKGGESLTGRLTGILPIWSSNSN